MKAVIQCGGKGTRLRPHTSILPKPLMPIGARPVLELVLKWLRRNGIRDVFITTGYLGHLIRSVCGDGNQWNMRITYTQEGSRSERSDRYHSCANSLTRLSWFLTAMYLPISTSISS
jgi:NDP-sugar pyrophosphorylase family protein